MTKKVQLGLNGFVRTGDYRRPRPGEFWDNGSDEVYTNICDRDLIEDRWILVPVEKKDNFIYEYDT